MPDLDSNLVGYSNTEGLCKNYADSGIKPMRTSCPQRKMGMRFGPGEDDESKERSDSGAALEADVLEIYSVPEESEGSDEGKDDKEG